MTTSKRTQQGIHQPPLTAYLAMAAADLRSVRPRAAADVAVWLEDVEHTIRCQEITGEAAEQFRRACGVRQDEAHACYPNVIECPICHGDGTGSDS